MIRQTALASFLIRALRIYCAVCGVVISIVIVVHCCRVVNRVPSTVRDSWYYKLSEARKMTIEDLQTGKILTFDEDAQCWQVLVSALRRPLLGSKSWGVFADPCMIRIKLFDANGIQTLLVDSDGNHLKCETEVFDSPIPLQVLFHSNQIGRSGVTP